MNDFVCSLAGRFSIGPYCVEPTVVFIGGAVILALLLLAIRGRRTSNDRSLSCPMCGAPVFDQHALEEHFRLAH